MSTAGERIVKEMSWTPNRVKLRDFFLRYSRRKRDFFGRIGSSAMKRLSRSCRFWPQGIERGSLRVDLQKECRPSGDAVQGDAKISGDVSDEAA